jgi:hypothetical protein
MFFQFVVNWNTFSDIVIGGSEYWRVRKWGKTVNTEGNFINSYREGSLPLVPGKI